MADTMTQYPRNFHKLEFWYYRVGKFGVFRGGPEKLEGNLEKNFVFRGCRDFKQLAV